ncbi:hypothetical protein [Labilithrix luteola]|uniref:hypothetical protein n=1 Tax=Labilithrix luteola TaxID=1391654 RepID=UPI0011BA5982|nr:hypothetical protein [Labilithrix luteola]
MVHARSIDAIAETAANHGATHYVVRNDEVEAIETKTTATNGEETTELSSSRKVKKRRMWAEVFRCR